MVPRKLRKPAQKPLPLPALPPMLRELMEERGWVQVDLAAAAGLSQKQVCRLLAGEPPGLLSLRGLLLAFPEQRERLLAIFFPNGAGGE